MPAKNASAGEPVSGDITEALKAMGDVDVASFPPGVVEYLREFKTQEIRDIVETLLYIYIAQNASPPRGEGTGVVEQSCYAYTSGPLFVLAEVGLIESSSRHATTLVRVTLPEKRSPGRSRRPVSRRWILGRSPGRPTRSSRSSSRER